MAETLLIAVLVFAGLAIVLLMDVHGKARAYEQGADPGRHRSPESVTSVELPSPHFNERATHKRESDQG
jgi:hypothetical protein